jgi:hypothetical protein
MTHYRPYTPMVEVLKPGTLGDVQLSQFTVSQEEEARSNIRQVVTQGRETTVRAGSYMKLTVGGTLMMSDTQMEQSSNMEVVDKARGDVLIAGLGLGLILMPILANPVVTSVTVIENNSNVVNLVAPTLQACEGGEKLVVIHADIREWKPKRGSRWHTIYFDIWPFVCEDNLDEMDELHERFKNYRVKGGWMGSWQRKKLQNLRWMRSG